MKTEEYTTVDFYRAVALVATGHDLKGLDLLESGRARFIFEKTLQLEHDVKRYFAETLLVEAQRFFRTIRYVKSRIF